MFDSIRARILATTGVIVAASLCVNTLINYRIASDSNAKALQHTLISLTASHTATVRQWVENKTALIASLTPHVGDSDPRPLLKQIADAGGFISVDMGYSNRVEISSDPSSIPPGFDPTTRAWFINARKVGHPIVTEPYMDANTHTLVVTFAAPGPQDTPISGVVEGDVHMDKVIANVRSIHPTKHSFGMLLNADGTIIAHPNQQLTLKSLADIAPRLSLTQLLTSGKPVEAIISGRNALLLAMPIHGTSWYTVVAMDDTEATDGMRSLLLASCIALLVLIVLSTLVIGIVTRRALRPLFHIRQAMENIGAGNNADLTKRLDVQGKDEVSQIARAFNQFVDKLANVMISIHSTSESVRIAAREIAAGNEDLSSRTESAAASLQQTSAALEQISATVAQSATSAQQANESVSSAVQVAQRGGKMISQVIETMSSIEVASGKIGDITGVIDGIAFQTNILALNAAVEAARAGEQGRGFAVVAGEVRTLAQRSAQAAKEIKNLIDSTVTSVASGSHQVRQSGETMTDIVNSVGAVSAIMGEITNAAEEQNRGISEINSAVIQLDTMVQQNAALVEESTAASAALQGQASELADTVGQFKM
ncbi:methyl-accepting chemotaxis protein [Edwardsiella ictaluri]|uniref:Methyl-accepting chemotaxis protein, putative n=1 Tax=Edwardsiella ictaluri (strain 93-146) TaxID=634503 RepID=C5BA26_EDWI9|nr:methyl-accepting chemotaxis protein [Edwardsiella ictaluri]ACR69147.1 methyl-accepting chemotaxis protein, putative [Edwardsiella ictaluri 93-146]AVZ83774.1 methyl-accepting chemotaxis protein [Edwardsiella ictaluri]EKS7764503.1 HAMP domain-containing protein [Edwardsiella ictaluri]EKS7771423.1 HAMP domain-containing protein [Edwardsiella ictaluri]EKS7774539.1 HAMP domain-containing protein [Edwardsiella ictaluri]